MISVLTGTPGAGKSSYAALLMAEHLSKRPGNVVATNMLLADDFAEQVVRRWMPRRWWFGGRARALESVRARVLVVDDTDDLRRVRVRPESGGVIREGQLLIVLDEAQGVLDSRASRAEGRDTWVTWATQHRKLGADVVAIVQDVDMLDAHWRRLAEHHVRLRDLRRARVWGFPLPIPLQVAHTFWMGGRGAMARKPVAMRVLRTARGHGLFVTTQTMHAGMDVDAIWLDAAPPARTASAAPPAPPASARDAGADSIAGAATGGGAESRPVPPPSVWPEGPTSRPAGSGQQVQR